LAENKVQKEKDLISELRDERMKMNNKKTKELYNQDLCILDFSRGN